MHGQQGTEDFYSRLSMDPEIEKAYRGVLGTLLARDLALYLERKGSEIEPLTGAYRWERPDPQGNHRGMETLARELYNADRSESPMTVIMYDIVDFGNTNRTLGSIEGDEKLKLVACGLVESNRETDVLFRRGDAADEFIKILPNMGSISAAEHIRRVLGILKSEVGVNARAVSYTYGPGPRIRTMRDYREEAAGIEQILCGDMVRAKDVPADGRSIFYVSGEGPFLF